MGSHVLVRCDVIPAQSQQARGIEVSVKSAWSARHAVTHTHTRTHARTHTRTHTHKRAQPSQASQLTSQPANQPGRQAARPPDRQAGRPPAHQAGRPPARPPARQAGTCVRTHTSSDSTAAPSYACASGDSRDSKYLRGRHGKG
jgi:hypothetical protein